MDLVSPEPPRAVYAAAADALADSVVRAVIGAHGTFRLVEQLPADEATGLAAVRVLGADVLAPYTLGRSGLLAEDTEVLAAAFTAFPRTDDVKVPGSDALVSAWRDWATAGLLRRLGAGDRLGAGELCAGALDALDAPGDDVWQCWPGEQRDWLGWSGLLAALTPLAAPGLDSPAREQARHRTLDLSRGVTRAVLRRDHLTAARLVRWLATAGPGPLAPEPLLRHLELIGPPDDPRMRLEIALARAALAGTALAGTDDEPDRSRG